MSERRPDNTILVHVKNATRHECIYTLPTQSVCGLRALIGAKFQIEFKYIILVYAGKMLHDVGTLAEHGIVDGTTVHLVVRKPIWLTASSIGTATRTTQLSKAARKDMVITRYREHCIKRMAADVLPKLETLLDNTELMRAFIFNDPRMQRTMELCPHIRHAMNSDASIREIASSILNPAKMDELSRKRDLSLLRLESMAGGMAILQRIYSCLYETNDPPSCEMSCTVKLTQSIKNPQLGKENRSPLPNPWTRQPRSRSLGISNLSLNCLRRLSRYNAIMARDFQANVSRPNAHSTNLDWLENKFIQVGNYLNRRNVYTAMKHRKNSAKSKSQRKKTFRSLFNEPIDNLMDRRTMLAQARLQRQARAQYRNSNNNNNNNNMNASDSLTVDDEISSYLKATMVEQLNADNDVGLSEDPAVRYHEQLEHLAKLGFNNRDQNLRALMATLGDVNGAVKRLKTTNSS